MISNIKTKYFLDPDGKPILKYNRHTMMKKAEKAFRKGEQYYKYKGETFAVPKMNKDGN